MADQILITGGSGLIGRALTAMLLKYGYRVSWLTQSNSSMNEVETFHWNIEKMEIDQKAIETADYIVHLAGEGIANKRWNKLQKDKILRSRVDSCKLIKQVITKNNPKPKAFICASGVGYYGYDNGGVWLKETSSFGDDFVANVVKEWEASADELEKIGIRTVKLRTGLVLSRKGGALAKIMGPVKWGLGAPLGSGDQYMSWIHIDDLCELYLKTITNTGMKGIYNAVSENPVSNREFNMVLSKVMKKPFFMPPVPSFVLRILLGEMASLVLGSGRVSAEKLVQSGITFKYPDLESALTNLLSKS